MAGKVRSMKLPPSILEIEKLRPKESLPLAPNYRMSRQEHWNQNPTS